MSKNNSIIVKKVKKGGGGGHHGGAWKVAYADFVTAMMAFFLLMWLLNMTSDEKRARLSAYFKYFSIYESGGTSWMDKSSEIFSESGESSQKALKEMDSESINSMEKELKESIAGELGGAEDQIIIDTVEGGVRIQITDKEGSLMFERGSTILTPKAKEILHVIGNNIKGLNNRVAIEGHTDALPYARSDYSNWELSTARASTARKELEVNGLNPEQVERVSGFADKDPLIKDNPQDPRNRRISIILKAAYVKKSKPKVINDTVNPTTEGNNKENMIDQFEKNLSLIKDNLKPLEHKTAQSFQPETGANSAATVKDIKVPDKTKYESAAEFKQRTNTSHIPLITNNEPVIKPPINKSVIKELAGPIISTDDLFRK